MKDESRESQCPSVTTVTPDDAAKIPTIKGSPVRFRSASVGELSYKLSFPRKGCFYLTKFARIFGQECPISE